MAEKAYRTIHGFIQFPPRDGEAAGKKVRNINVRQTGVHEKEALSVSCTVWESHAGVSLAEGDLVTVEGSYSTNTATKQDGSRVTYHNLSVNRIVNLGGGNAGAKPGVENAVAEAADDDIPF